MSSSANFADPQFEPSDEDLLELSREAFAGVAELRLTAREQMRVRIAALRVDALARVAALIASRPGPARAAGSDEAT